MTQFNNGKKFSMLSRKKLFTVGIIQYLPSKSWGLLLFFSLFRRAYQRAKLSMNISAASSFKEWKVTIRVVNATALLALRKFQELCLRIWTFMKSRPLFGVSLIFESILKTSVRMVQVLFRYSLKYRVSISEWSYSLTRHIRPIEFYTQNPSHCFHYLNRSCRWEIVSQWNTKSYFHFTTYVYFLLIYISSAGSKSWRIWISIWGCEKPWGKKGGRAKVNYSHGVSPQVITRLAVTLEGRFRV